MTTIVTPRLKLRPLAMADALDPEDVHQMGLDELDRIEAELIVLVGGHTHDAAAGHLDRHLVVEIERRRKDHLVADRRDGEHRVHEGHVGARRDHDAAATADVDTMGAVELRRWDRRGLQDLRMRNPMLWTKIQSVLGHDLVEKIRLQEGRAVVSPAPA